MDDGLSMKQNHHLPFVGLNSRKISFQFNFMFNLFGRLDLKNSSIHDGFSCDFAVYNDVNNARAVPTQTAQTAHPSSAPEHASVTHLNGVPPQPGSFS